MEPVRRNINACHIISAVLLLRHRVTTVHTSWVKGSIATHGAHMGGMFWTRGGGKMHTNQFVNSSGWFWE